MPPFFDMCKVYSATCIARATTTEEQWSAIHSLDQQVASAIARYCEIFTKYLVRANSPNGENTVATLDMPVLQMGSDAIEKLLSGYFDEVYQPTTFPENITHLKTDSDLRDRPYYVNSLLVSVLNVHFTDFLHKLRGKLPATESSLTTQYMPLLRRVTNLWNPSCQMQWWIIFLLSSVRPLWLRFAICVVCSSHVVPMNSCTTPSQASLRMYKIKSRLLLCKLSTSSL